MRRGSAPRRGAAAGLWAAGRRGRRRAGTRGGAPRRAATLRGDRRRPCGRGEPSPPGGRAVRLRRLRVERRASTPAPLSPRARHVPARNPPPTGSRTIRRRGRRRRRKPPAAGPRRTPPAARSPPGRAGQARREGNCSKSAARRCAACGQQARWRRGRRGYARSLELREVQAASAHRRLGREALRIRAPDEQLGDVCLPLCRCAQRR